MTIDSSTSDSPSSTTPSTGILAPGRTSSRSPTCTSAVGTSTRCAVAEHDRPRRGEVEQGADRVVGAAPGAHLEPVPEQHERGQHGGRLVEHLAAAGEGDADAVQPAGADRDGDQHHHVQGAGAQRPVGAVEEDPGRVEDHRQGQQQREHVVAQPERRRHGEAEHLAADRATTAGSGPTAPPRRGTGCACRGPCRPSTSRRVPPWPIASCGRAAARRRRRRACRARRAPPCGHGVACVDQLPAVLVPRSAAARSAGRRRGRGPTGRRSGSRSPGSTR